MTSDRTLVAIPCSLSPGMFSSERVFEVKLANGDTYKGVSPRHFCWTKDRRIVGDRTPPEAAEGFVAARIVDEPGDDQFAVEVPDGEVLAVWKKDIQQRPTVIAPPSGTSSRK